MKPVVLLDCDGPLADFGQAYLDALWVETGASHSPREVDRWDMHNCEFFVELSQRFEHLRRRVDAHVIKPGFCDGIDVAHGAKAAVAKLVEVADVYVVTSPWDSSPTWMHERTRWVAKHFPEIGRRRVIHAAQKHLIRGDIFVDDKPSHIEEWTRHWPNGAAVLFDMHHNRTEGAGLQRGGWPEVLAALDAYA